MTVMCLRLRGGGGVGPCKLLSGWCKQSPEYFFPHVGKSMCWCILGTHSLSLRG